MCLLIQAGHQNVVWVDEDEGKTAENPVHEALERHASILQPKWHPQELEKAKWSDEGHLLHVRGVDQDLVVALLQVELAEDGRPPCS